MFLWRPNPTPGYIDSENPGQILTQLPNAAPLNSKSSMAGTKVESSDPVSLVSSHSRGNETVIQCLTLVDP